MKIAYLFTTFPLLSETPYQRELRALNRLPVKLEIWSLWGGGATFDGMTVRRFSKWRLAALIWLLPYWVVRKPGVLGSFIRRFARQGLRSPLNAGETVLGVLFALCYAAHFSRTDRRPDLLHAAWATLPATAAQLLAELLDVPFSMGAHAYDVFRDGGDWDLNRKLERSALVVTSSQSTYRRLIERGSDPRKTAVVRRGMDPLPPRRAFRRRRVPLRILSVGRLIEKKGYAAQLKVFAELQASGFEFDARIVGSGPLRRDLEERIDKLSLHERVVLIGSLPHESVLDQYGWADVLLFMGTVAKDGDRDGLPNVVPEAMAYGVPVVATEVAGVPEAIKDGQSGLLLRDDTLRSCVKAIRQLQDDDQLYERLSNGGRCWVEVNYDVRKNADHLLKCFQAVTTAAEQREGLSLERATV